MSQSQHAQHINSGFTLIELMIAMALGTLILYIAFSGIRMASQTMTITKRMSLENDVMRAGYYIAMDEADTWRMYDNPDDPGTCTSLSAFGTSAQQCLRCFNQGWGRGMAFTPLSMSMPPSGGGSASELGLMPATETQRGWDPLYTWPANDSRTWFHGNMAECVWTTNHVFGDYGIFCHHKLKPNLLVFNGSGVSYGSATPNHTWQCNILESLKNNLGYYGVADYMPANTVFAVNGDPGPDNAFGTNDDTDNQLEIEWCAPGGSGGQHWRFSDGDGGTCTPRGLYRNTRDVTFPVVPACPWTTTPPPTDINDLVSMGFYCWATDRSSDAYDISSGNHGIQSLLASTQVNYPAFPVVNNGTGAPTTLKPANWPSLTVKVIHYINNCRMVTMCSVDWTSALTGQSFEYSFATTSTSLRGARQMRKPNPSGGPNSGWAQPGFCQYWVNAGDHNLDYP